MYHYSYILLLQVKVWLLPEEDNLSELSNLNPVVAVPKQNYKIENVTWNPMAEGVLTFTCNDCVVLYDVTSQEQKICKCQIVLMRERERESINLKINLTVFCSIAMLLRNIKTYGNNHYGIL